MKRHCVIGILLAVVTFAGSGQLSAQAPGFDHWRLVLIPNGETVYDVVNHVTWLADANLPAHRRFGIPLCDGSGVDPCINASGSIDLASATAWILAMNNANYLGHSNWQLPTTPFLDGSGKCPKIGTNGSSFGFGCSSGALGSLFYNALGLQAPNTAVPIPNIPAGPFSNFQPYSYWSQTGDGSGGNGVAIFSFATGSQGGETPDNFLYALPMIQGKIPGTPAARGMGLQVNPDGRTVYDPMAGVTWLADANLAANDTMGLPRCDTTTTPMYCVAKDGSMDYASAGQFIVNMNAYDHGEGYLGQTDWELPPVNPGCPTFGCKGHGNPMGELFYNQLGLSAGTPVVAAPDIAVGPFENIRPYLYWSCLGSTIRDACQAQGPAPNFDAEFSFSFGNGFLGTDRSEADLYVTAYYVGCDLPGLWCFLLSRL